MFHSRDDSFKLAFDRIGSGRRKRAGVRKLQQAMEALEPRWLLTTYFVDNAAGHNGSNSNSGTSLSAPFLTIQKGASLAKPGDTVDILAGTYRETVTPAHSGTAAAPITYQAYQNQKVVIDGANIVGGWTSYSGNIYQSAAMNWTMGGQDDQLFVDGQMINYARWPNTSLDVSHPTWALAGANTTGAVNSGGALVNTVYDPNLNQPAGYWTGATIHIESGQTWIYETATITSYTRAVVNGISYGVITYTSSFSGDNYYAVPGDPYYITGDPFYTAGQFQDLDAPGQFYRDPVSGNLYVWTPQSDSPAVHVVEAKQRLWGFDLSGMSYTNITGISLFACGIDSSSTGGHLLINGVSAQYVSHFEDYQGNWTPTYSNGISVIGGTGIVLDGGYDTLENSTIAYSAGDGVFLGGSNNNVYNNVIHDVDYSGTNAAGISTLEFVSTQISSNIISFNTVYNAGRSLINVSDLAQSRVDYNWLFNGTLQGVDCGGIYGYGAVGNGSEIDHNVISNVSNSIPGYETDGIFLDQGCSGFTIDHNVVFGVTDGIKQYVTGSNAILNNTVADTHVSLNIYGTSGTELIANNITTSSNSISAGQPGLNVSNNIVTPIDPVFVSPSTDNFQLQSSSPAIDAGMAVAPYTNGYLGSAPDLGAYEYGATLWTYGASGSATALAANAIPIPWTAGDIGSPAINGNSTYSNGIFAVSGSGTDIWNESDQFQFVDTPVTGDQIITARLTSQAAIQSWSKAGLMFRANASAGSPFVMVADTPGNGVDLIARDASGNLDLGRGAAMANPVWLELVRSGNVFTALDSSDGVSWNTISTITLALPASGLMGLAVTAEDPTQISTAVFDNVSLQLPAAAGLTATAASAGQINLTWSAYANTTGYQLQRSTDGVTFTSIADLGAVTSYSDSSALSAGTAYTYRLIANSTLGPSIPSLTATATALMPAPTGVTATARVGAITVSWTAVPGAAAYNLYRGTAAGGESNIPFGTGITTTSFVDSSISASNTYYYFVTATSPESVGSTEVSATPLAAPLAKPTGVAATAAIGSITITWNPSAGATGYNIYRGTAAGGESKTPYATGITTTSFVDTSLSSLTTYYYYVTASSPESLGSAEVFATPLAAPLAKPTGVTATAGIGSVKITWNASAGSTSYSIYRGIAAGAESKTVYAAGITTTSFVDTSVSYPAIYYYYVTASAPESLASAEVSAVPLAVPLAKPTGVTATAGAGSIKITWNASAGASSYNLYRGTTAGGESKTAYATGITTTLFIDTSVSSPTAYYYYVTASSPESLASAEVFSTPLSVPLTKPTGVTVTAGIGSIAITWDASAGATGYNVYRGTIAGGEGTTPYAAGVTGTKYTDTAVSTGVTYYYYVTATAPESAPSAEVSAASLVFNKLTGTPIGTSTSWLNNGDTIAQVFDGNFNSYFDAANGNLTNWVGLDLGSAQTINQIRYAPRAGYEWRMVGGQFQVSSTPDFSSNVVTIATIATSPVAGQFTSIAVNPGGTYRYVRYTGGTQWVNIAEMEVDGISAAPVKLTGTPIGTSTSWLNNGDTIAQVFDGNFNSYFDAANSSLTNWVGLDLGTVQTITQIRYAPRPGYEWRMVGGKFQVSTTPDFSSGVVTICTIATAPTAGAFTAVAVNPSAAYRYIRYVGGTGWVNIAEMEVDGASTAPQVQFTGKPIGTPTSWLNNGDTIAQVFDGNLNTYYDAANSSLTNWAGLDLGTAKNITEIQFAPRAGYEWRMAGGQFQVSNTADFSSGVVTIYTVPTAPTAGELTTVAVSPGGAYRYIRYIGGTGWVNIAEMQVIGTA